MAEGFCMVLAYNRRFKSIKQLMEYNANRIVCPPLSSKPPQRAGQLEVYNLIFPTVIPILHANLDQQQVKQCTNLDDYIALIQHASTEFNNLSETLEINARRFEAIKSLDKNNQWSNIKTGTSGGNYNNHNTYNNNKLSYTLLYPSKM